MTRTMYDGIDSNAAPIAKAFPAAEMVAGYVDGLYEWSQDEWNLFPNSKHVRISAIPGSADALTADVADCETGDYDPGQAAEWAHAKRAAGYDRPTIYCNLSTAGAVRAATGSLVLGVDYDLWIADWTGSSHSVRFADGRSAAVTQFESFSFYDISTVYNDAWPVRSAHSTPPPAKGPFRQTVPNGNTKSLDDIAAERNTKVDAIVDLSMANMNAANQNVMGVYLELDAACAAAHIHHATMPTGMVYYTEND